MLNKLPLEVIENICFYVRLEDLVSVWDVVGMEASESFWRKISKRQGYKQMPYENRSWKNVFLQNMNWFTQNYKKRTYKCEPNIIQACQTGSLQNKELLMGKHLIVSRCGEEMLLWDLSSSPNLVQSLPAKYFSHKGNKLVTYNSSEVIVYSYDTQTLSKLYELPVELPFNNLGLCTFTEDYLVAYDKYTSYVKIVDLRELTESSLMIPVAMSTVFSLNLSNNLLLILNLDGSNYKIKRFDLMNKTWLQDLVLFESAALIEVPRLEIGSNLIVSWCNQLEAPGITPVKIFGWEGTYIASLPSTSSYLELTGTELIKPIENILWMIVGYAHLIFSTSKTTFSIWSPESPGSVKVVQKEAQLHCGQKVVSSYLLVLSYSYCFKVIDFKKPVYLYEVLLDNQCSLDYFQGLSFFTNQHFYIHFQYVEEVEDNSSSNKILPFASSICLNRGHKNIIKKKYFMHIYDFTGTNPIES